MERLKLTAKQQRAIEALLSEPTVQAAAKAAGVSKATIFRWLGDSAFSKAYHDLRGEMLESTMTALQAATSEAIETLKSVMKDAIIHPAARVSAARVILEMALRTHQEFEVERRLKALEDQLNTPGRQAA